MEACLPRRSRWAAVPSIRSRSMATTALITGGTSGISRATANKLAQLGVQPSSLAETASRPCAPQNRGVFVKPREISRAPEAGSPAASTLGCSFRRGLPRSEETFSSVFAPTCRARTRACSFGPTSPRSAASRSPGARSRISCATGSTSERCSTRAPSVPANSHPFLIGIYLRQSRPNSANNADPITQPGGAPSPCCRVAYSTTAAIA
jgi:hypothetical protein